MNEPTLFDAPNPTVNTPENRHPLTPLGEALNAALELHPEVPRSQAMLTVAATNPALWTPGDLANVSRVLTGMFRARLEAAGWDVDLLPTTPVTPTPAPNEPAPASQSAPATPAPPAPDVAGAVAAHSVHATVSVNIHTDGRIALNTPTEHPLRQSARDLPGATWAGQTSQWLLPITRRTAISLRLALRGTGATVTPDAIELLRAAANSTPEPDVTLTPERIEVRFEHTDTLQDAMKRHLLAKWDGVEQCWAVSLDRAEQTRKIAETHNLTCSDELNALADATYATFDYDLTIDGLRGVPTTELRTVRAQKARGKTASLADRLTDMKIESVYDLLTHVPLRYLDRSSTKKIRDLTVGEKVGFLAHITRIGQYDRMKRNVRLTVTDGSAEVTITFFSMPWIPQRFRVNEEVIVYGRLDVWEGGGRRSLQMSNPVMDPSGDDTALIVPIYPQSEKSQVTTWDLHNAAMEAVRRLGDLQDPIPSETVTRHNLMPRAAAYTQVHFPDTILEATEARTRLAFDELLRMQLALGIRRHATADEPGVAHHPDGALTTGFLDGLGFPLTGAQSRAITEIRADLQQPHPMHRLLQGDVGSGKTIVALMTLLTGIEGGYQGAMMAPTEILASQLHFEAAERLGKLTRPDGTDLEVRFLGGKTRIKERREILAGLEDGTVDLVIGTHALISEGVNFHNLGIVVVDEQHRFGVEQRAALRAKGNNGTPDVLIMTATPIPRTSALTAFGDLQITALDELPPGRTPIATTWEASDPVLDGLTGPPWDLVVSEVAAGRQAYVVASLVEENEKIAAESAEFAYAALADGALTGLRLGIVHGKQDRPLREATMSAFKNGELDVLVATTVIEVGVNVPNATVMVVLNAPRFGIAQLHQIRGRVGRGRWASHCILTGKAGSADGVARMAALVKSTDGFYLSEVDLELRGAGTIFGASQSGQTDLRVADLNTDKNLIVVCREEADTLLATDHTLSRRPGLRAEVHASLGTGAAEWLSKS